MEEIDIEMSKDAVRSLHNFLSQLNNYTQEEKGGKYAVYVLDCFGGGSRDEIYEPLLKEHNAWSEVYEEANRFAKESEYSISTWIESIGWKGGRVDYTYPDYFDIAAFADKAKYVGQTNDLARRVRQHLIGDGTTFTKYYPPYGISHVEWVETREEAKNREGEIQNEFNNIPPGVQGYASHMTGLVNSARSPEETTYVDGLGPVDDHLIHAHGLESASDEETRQTIEKTAYNVTSEEIEEMRQENTLIFAAGGK